MNDFEKLEVYLALLKEIQKVSNHLVETAEYGGLFDTTLLRFDIRLEEMIDDVEYQVKTTNEWIESIAKIHKRVEEQIEQGYTFDGEKGWGLHHGKEN